MIHKGNWCCILDKRDIIINMFDYIFPSAFFWQPHEVKQQGEFESFHRDLIVGFGSWEFDPMDLENPFQNNEGSVHLWHGDDDRLVPVTLQRYIASKLPWIHYHEIPGSGHFFINLDGMSETILNALLVGEKK